MKKEKTVKTNVMRILDDAKIDYRTSSYEVSEDDLSGVHGAEMLGIDPSIMFKTLVTKGEKNGYIVYCIPVAEDLDLKKCAAVAGDKRVELIHVKEMLGITGYIRGGCSPIGMKKQFPTFIHESAKDLDEIYVSAGVRGGQVILSPIDLANQIGAKFGDLIR